jgi:hypothetical protein
MANQSFGLNQDGDRSTWNYCRVLSAILFPVMFVTGFSTFSCDPEWKCNAMLWTLPDPCAKEILALGASIFLDFKSSGRFVGGRALAVRSLLTARLFLLDDGLTGD